MHLRNLLLRSNTCDPGFQFYTCNANGFVGCCPVDPCSSGCTDTVTTTPSSSSFSTTITLIQEGSSNTLQPKSTSSEFDSQPPTSTSTAAPTSTFLLSSLSTSFTPILIDTSSFVKPTTTFTSATTSTTSATSQPTSSSSKSSMDPIIGGAIGGGAALCLIIGFVVYAFKRSSNGGRGNVGGELPFNPDGQEKLPVGIPNGMNNLGRSFGGSSGRNSMMSSQMGNSLGSGYQRSPKAPSFGSSSVGSNLGGPNFDAPNIGGPRGGIGLGGPHLTEPNLGGNGLGGPNLGARSRSGSRSRDMMTPGSRDMMMPGSRDMLSPRLLRSNDYGHEPSLDSFPRNEKTGLYPPPDDRHPAYHPMPGSSPANPAFYSSDRSNVPSMVGTDTMSSLPSLNRDLPSLPGGAIIGSNHMNLPIGRDNSKQSTYSIPIGLGADRGTMDGRSHLDKIPSPPRPMDQSYRTDRNGVGELPLKNYKASDPSNNHVGAMMRPMAQSMDIPPPYDGSIPASQAEQVKALDGKHEYVNKSLRPPSFNRSLSAEQLPTTRSNLPTNQSSYMQPLPEAHELGHNTNRSTSADPFLNHKGSDLRGQYSPFKSSAIPGHDQNQQMQLEKSMPTGLQAAHIRPGLDAHDGIQRMQGGLPTAQGRDIDHRTLNGDSNSRGLLDPRMPHGNTAALRGQETNTRMPHGVSAAQRDADRKMQQADMRSTELLAMGRNPLPSAQGALHDESSSKGLPNQLREADQRMLRGDATSIESLSKARGLANGQGQGTDRLPIQRHELDSRMPHGDARSVDTTRSRGQTANQPGTMRQVMEHDRPSTADSSIGRGQMDGRDQRQGTQQDRAQTDDLPKRQGADRALQAKRFLPNNLPIQGERLQPDRYQGTDQQMAAQQVAAKKGQMGDKGLRPKGTALPDTSLHAETGLGANRHGALETGHLTGDRSGQNNNISSVDNDTPNKRGLPMQPQDRIDSRRVGVKDQLSRTDKPLPNDHLMDQNLDLRNKKLPAIDRRNGAQTTQTADGRMLPNVQQSDGRSQQVPGQGPNQDLLHAQTAQNPQARGNGKLQPNGRQMYSNLAGRHPNGHPQTEEHVTSFNNYDGSGEPYVHDLQDPNALPVKDAVTGEAETGNLGVNGNVNANANAHANAKGRGRGNLLQMQRGIQTTITPEPDFSQPPNQGQTQTQAQTQTQTQTQVPAMNVNDAGRGRARGRVTEQGQGQLPVAQSTAPDIEAEKPVPANANVDVNNTRGVEGARGRGRMQRGRGI